MMAGDSTIIDKINTESKKIKYTELYGNDIIFTTIAIIITIIITIYFIVLINFKKYHKAWKENENNIRCNPVFMPFSKYISTGSLFGTPISGSENLKYCVDNISVNVSGDYSADFTGVFKNMTNMYGLIENSITILKQLVSSLIELFKEIINVVLRKMGIISMIISSLINTVITVFDFFPIIFSVAVNVVFELINVIKYILICVVNLTYKCVLGPVASLVQLLTVWGTLLMVLLLISLLFMFSNIPFGIWPFYLGVTILAGVLMALLMPISLLTNVLFIALFGIITKINMAVMGFIDGIDTGEYINHNIYDSMRRDYITRKKTEAGNNLFSPPNFDDCKKIFANT